MSLAACAAAPPATSGSRPSPAAPTDAPAPSSAVIDPSATAAPPPAASASAATPAAPTPLDLGAWTRELEAPVTSLALGEPRVAALAGDPWLLEGGAWRRVPLPEALRPPPGVRDDARVYFGRDDWPRIMGARTDAGGARQLYLRWKGGRWIAEKNELAKLADPPLAALFGLLGHADPEVVCKVGDDCIIKRRTGWKMLRASVAPFRVELHDGRAWGLLDGAVGRLDADKAWTRVAPPSPVGQIGGVFATGDELWLSEPGAGALHHLKHGAWSRHDAPGARPLGMWGTGPSDVWLATADGVARFDGAAWARVKGPSGPLAEVFGRGGEVWAAGESGAWRLARAKR
ncbi:MAG: hypothetical protein IT374_22490 [Polyangiaceae bacterium]|nr:hypothetical protein [Polyangiaceae bacterium]